MSVIEAPEVQTPEPLVEPDPVLMRAAGIVRGRWVQGETGAMGGPRCATGAISEAAPNGGRYLESLLRLQESLGVRAVPDWNDEFGRTAEQVADAMERAAYRIP